MKMLDLYIEKIRSRFSRNDKKEKILSVETWSGNITTDIETSHCSFVVFDTELTGLNPRKDFIVSIGAVKMTGGTIHAGKNYYRLVKPSGDVSEKSIVIHGITPDDLKEAQGLDDVMPAFLNFISESVIIGHFVHIDLNFVNNFLSKTYGTTLKNPSIDTYAIHEWLYENISAFKKHFGGGSIKSDLFSLANRYGIEVDSFHNALNDAFITAQLFQRFKYFLDASGVDTLSELLDIAKA